MLFSLLFPISTNIAMDDDWTALRFRDVRFVKTMTRNGKIAISAEGKARVTPESQQSI